MPEGAYHGTCQGCRVQGEPLHLTCNSCETGKMKRATRGWEPEMHHNAIIKVDHDCLEYANEKGFLVCARTRTRKVAHSNPHHKEL